MDFIKERCGPSVEPQQPQAEQVQAEAEPMEQEVAA